MNASRKKKFACTQCTKLFIDNAHLKEHQVLIMLKTKNCRLNIRRKRHLFVIYVINGLQETIHCKSTKNRI